MQKHTLASFALVLGMLASCQLQSAAAELVTAKDGSGVYGYDDTPVLPWCGFRVHDANRPAPKRVSPCPAAQYPALPPSDAVILFNGTDMLKWKPEGGKIVEGTIESTGGNLVTKDSFGDCQIHLEWMGPANFKGP